MNLKSAFSVPQLSQVKPVSRLGYCMIASFIAVSDIRSQSFIIFWIVLTLKLMNTVNF